MRPESDAPLSGRIPYPARHRLSAMKPPKGKSRRAVFSTAIACAVAVLGVRLWLAWLYSVDVNPDGAIVHLMVRHVIEGGPWPVFFYGQAYMGSFEPLVSALVARLFGFSTFAVCCGTALFGAATVICAAFWAWHAAGRRAGAITLALLILGLQPYIHYFASPRGGYGALLFFTTSTLALGAHLLEREIRGAPRNAPWFLVLGIGAGIGFWSNFLVLPAIAAIGLSFIAWRGFRAFRARIVFPAIGGFALGSLPMWIWNARNGWATMNMSDSVGFSILGAAKSLLLLVGPRLRELLCVNKGFPTPVVAAVVAIHVLLIPAALLILLDRKPRMAASGGDAGCRRDVPAKARIHASVTAGWLVLFVLCFIASPQYAEFNTPRYLLPMVPVIAWMAGVGATRSKWRAARAVTLACAALALAWQLWLLPNSFSFHRKHAPNLALFEQLGDKLESLGVSTAYAAYIDYMVNPLHGESVVCSDPRLERFAPYARQIELDPAPAAVDNFGGIGAWALASGGSVKTDSVPHHTIYYNLRPPPTPLAEVPLEGAAFAYHDGEPLEDPRALFDRRRITMLRDTHPDSVPETVVVTFPQPVTVSAVRLWGVATPPVSWDVSVRDAPDSEFRKLASQSGRTDFFWSGPRFFWSGPQQRHEIRFPQVTAREFRLRFTKTPNRPHIAIAEIQFLRDAPECGETLEPDIDELVSQLRLRGITRLYADRWIANQVHERSGGVIWTSRARRGMIGNGMTFLDPSADITLAPGTAILAPHCAAPSLREALRTRHIEFREEALPGFGTLFFPSPATEEDGAPLLAGIRFAGGYAFGVHSPRWAESRLSVMGDDTPLEVIRDLYEDVKSSFIVLHAYTNALVRAGKTDEAGEVAKRIDNLDALRAGGPAQFFSDLKWLGASAEPATAERGGYFTMRTAWCGNLKRLARYFVFVHFVGPRGVRFQHDHGLDVCIADDDDPFGEDMPFFDRQEVRVPYDIPPGKYDLHIGIYPMNGGSRVHPKTSRPTRRNAIVIKDFLEVKE